jgi:hypothetical protein
VQKYIVWRTLDREIDWFSLQDGEYIRLECDEKGIIKSQISPGLWLTVEAMLSGAMADVLAKLQAGLDSIDNRSFRVGWVEECWRSLSEA